MSGLQTQNQLFERLEAKSKLAVRALQRLVAPARCMTCLREGMWLCAACAVELPDFPPMRYEKESALTGMVSAGSYGSEYLRRGIGWLKFRGVQDLAPVLAGLVAPKLAAIAPLAQLRAEAVLIPIPLHRRRLRQRGFNQSLVIAQALSEQTGVPIADILMRKHATLAQAQLPHELRAENVEDAFELSGSIPNKKYLLILDDVSTTGSTLLAAASAFAQALADKQGKQVWGVTVARG